MKKIVLIILFAITIFSLSACSDEKNVKVEKTKEKVNVEKEKDIYIKSVKELKKVKESSEDIPFTIEVLCEKMSNEVRYQVIIDNPSNELRDISAVAIHDKQTDDIFPSVGIFDKKVDLIPSETPSGVILVGYIPYEGEIEDFEMEVKVLISYKIDDIQYKSYYVTKK